MIDYLSDIFVYNSKAPLLFNSALFLGLFLGFYGIYILTKRAYLFRLGYVILFSLFFYYKCSGIYFLLLIFSSVIDYTIALGIHRLNHVKWRKVLLLLSVAINLGVLFYFKYTNFFIQNINLILNEKIGSLDIFLPIGISFYTFQTMSYTIDVYRNKLKPSTNFLEFLFFVSFFPQLVAGPIVRAAQFIPQIARTPKLSNYGLDKALLLIMGGLIKKVVISDYISINFVDRVFENPQLYSSFENLLGAYGYAVQIYCDFSGYSDIAIGLALLMGFRLPPNFRSPYQSASITEFWRRWHISLSTWLRDYLYISLGGNRKGNVRTYVNLFIVMFLGGLWHGAAWKFAIWGMLHGTMLAIERAFKKVVRLPRYLLFRLLGWFFTFHFVVFAWIFFRANNYEKAKLMIVNIANIFNDNYDVLSIFMGYRNVILLCLLAFITHFTPNKVFFCGYKLYKAMPIYSKAVLLSLVMLLVYIFTSSGVQPFIYFQF